MTVPSGENATSATIPACPLISRRTSPRRAYPRVALFLRIGRILRVILPGWAASGAAGADDTGVTSSGAGPAVSLRVQAGGAIRGADVAAGAPPPGTESRRLRR